MSELGRLPSSRPGEVVSVRGPLGVQGEMQSLVKCPTSDVGQNCCNAASSLVVVGVPPDVVAGAGRCGGDESAQCCTVPAFGQTVVMTGKLVRVEGETPPWRIENGVLCVPTNEGGN